MEFHTFMPKMSWTHSGVLATFTHKTDFGKWRCLDELPQEGFPRYLVAKCYRSDKLFLSLGIDEATEQTVANLDMKEESVVIANAYLEGINAFIAEGPTPIEFYLTGLDKQPFVINDVYNTLGYMAFSFAMAHKTDPLVSNIKDKLGVAYLKDFGVGCRSKYALDQKSQKSKLPIPYQIR